MLDLSQKVSFEFEFAYILLFISELRICCSAFDIAHTAPHLDSAHTKEKISILLTHMSVLCTHVARTWTVVQCTSLALVDSVHTLTQIQ